MKKPMTTYPSGVKSKKVASRVPDNTENFKPVAGGKINPYGANMAGDTKVKPPSQMSHVTTPIDKSEIHGENVGGLRRIPQPATSQVKVVIPKTKK